MMSNFEEVSEAVGSCPFTSEHSSLRGGLERQPPHHADRLTQLYEHSEC